MFNKIFPENIAVYDIMWRIMVQPNEPELTI